jgi:putative transposase
MCCRSTGRKPLLDRKRRGLQQYPKPAINDGALGFWTALREMLAMTREQRCWIHKTMSVLNAMPESVQAKAKGYLHDIHWPAGYCAAMSREAGRPKQKPKRTPP